MVHIFQESWLNHLVFAVMVLGIAFVLSRVLRFFIQRYMIAASMKLNVDPTKYSFFKNAVTFIVYLIAFIVIFYSVPQMRAYGVTLFASAGIFAAIIGFASQSAFSNIISGVFLVIFKPFSVGHVIRVGDLHTGTVEDITLRHTVINNFENRRIVIPNSIISAQTIVNSSMGDPKVCMFVFMTISFESDISLAKRIMQEEAMDHPDFLDNRTPEDKEKGTPAVVVRLTDFLDSGMQLRASVWAKDSPTGFALRCDLHQRIKERFDREEIVIPYPHRVLIQKETSEKQAHGQA
jgi:small conductance mechanosensitive channel